MGGRLWAGKPYRYVTATKVDSAFYPPWDGKMSISRVMIINGNGGYGLLAAYRGGPAAQADWLGPKVGGHLAPFLYPSREPSELSQWLCYDDSTINIVVVIIIIIIMVVFCEANSECNLDVMSTPSHRLGTVMSPGYPSVYPENVQCNITLRPRTDLGERVQLIFVNFDLHYPTGNPSDPYEYVRKIYWHIASFR